MKLLNFFRPQPPIPMDLLDHPDFRRMSKRDLADLPMPRPFPAPAPARD